MTDVVCIWFVVYMCGVNGERIYMNMTNQIHVCFSWKMADCLSGMANTRAAIYIKMKKNVSYVSTFEWNLGREIGRAALGVLLMVHREGMRWKQWRGWGGRVRNYVLMISHLDATHLVSFLLFASPVLSSLLLSTLFFSSPLMSYRLFTSLRFSYLTLVSLRFSFLVFSSPPMTYRLFSSLLFSSLLVFLRFSPMSSHLFSSLPISSLLFSSCLFSSLCISSYVFASHVIWCHVIYSILFSCLCLLLLVISSLLFSSLLYLIFSSLWFCSVLFSSRVVSSLLFSCLFFSSLVLSCVFLSCLELYCLDFDLSWLYCICIICICYEVSLVSRHERKRSWPYREISQQGCESEWEGNTQEETHVRPGYWRKKATIRSSCEEDTLLHIDVTPS